VCVGEWTCLGTTFALVNGHKVVLCFVVNGHMDVLHVC